MMTSYDIHGPVVRPRIEKLWTWADPLGFRDNFRYEFEMEILDALQTESLASVLVSEKELKSGSTYNDHYGFGASRDAAIRDAQDFAADLAGANVDVVVTTELLVQPVFFDDKTKPFYSGSVHCFHVPCTWGRQEGADPLKRVESFETWRNGAPGKDAKRLQAIIDEGRAADAAGDRRNGPLR